MFAIGEKCFVRVNGRVSVNGARHYYCEHFEPLRVKNKFTDACSVHSTSPVYTATFTDDKHLYDYKILIFFSALAF